MALAMAIECALAKGVHFIGQAPTGTGKTIAYAVPMILYSLQRKKKVIISTASKALQKQLVNRDLPKLQQVLSFRFHMSLGSQNYFCDKRMFQGNQLGLFGGCEDAHVLRQIAALRLKNPAATFLDCDFHVPESLKRRINRDSQACTPKCPMQAQCAYKLSAQKQRDANIIITNHHKVLHFVKRGSRKLDSVGAIVFDECHRLEDIAAAVFGEHLESKEVMTAIKELYDMRSTDGILSKIRIARDQKDLMTEAAKSVTKILYDLYEAAQRDKDNVGKEDEEHLRQLQSSLERFGTLLQRSKVDVLQLYSARIAGFTNTIDIILKKDREVIRWKKVTNRSLAYATTPLSVSKFLQQRLFNPNKITTIHVSATISTGKKEKMAFYKKTTGIINAEEMTVESPYDYRKQAAICRTYQRVILR
jgi:ATP-dependent DNA helicase DinG